MTADTAGHQSSWPAKLRRIRALVRKETYQVLRDPSSIAIGVVLPLILILLFGYGLSLDVKNVPLALVMDDASSDANELAGSFELSPCFRPQISRSMPVAQQLLLEQKVDGIVRIQSDRSEERRVGHAPLQLIVHGADANRARIIQDRKSVVEGKSADLW